MTIDHQAMRAAAERIVRLYGNGWDDDALSLARAYLAHDAALQVAVKALKHCASVLGDPPNQMQSARDALTAIDAALASEGEGE